MSKSVQDYASFAANVKPERGSFRHELRLNTAKVLCPILVFLISFALVSVAQAQMDMANINGSSQNINVDGRSDGDVFLSGGSVSGNSGTVTDTDRAGIWDVQGDLTVGDLLTPGTEFVKYLTHLNVSGDLNVAQGRTIQEITSITLGNGMISMGNLMNIDNINVAGDLTFGSGTLLTNVGTITANNITVSMNTALSGFDVLYAREGIANNGTITNNGVISTYLDFDNNGMLSGNGVISTGGYFNNNRTGIITDGLVINGPFNNHGGTIAPGVGDVIRVTGGNTARIDGGTVDVRAYTNAAVGEQYLFLATDPEIDSLGRSGAGNLHVNQELKAGGTQTSGSVRDFTPVYGTWDGTKYVAGEKWQQHQYYWLEVQRAYTYGNQAATINQIAIGNYIDKVGGRVNGTNTGTGLWNMLRQLDGISDSRANNPYYDPNYADHQGDINPVALRALDQLSGQIYSTIGIASVHNTGVVNMTLADTLRSDVFKFSLIGNPNNAIRGQAIAPLRYNRWATLLGVGGTSKYDGNASGYEQSFGGVLAGMDRSFWTGTRLGAYLSVGGGEVSLDDLQERTKTVDLMIGMYLRQEMYFGYGLVAAGFGQDTYKTTRNLSLIGHGAESRTHASIGSLYMERGIDIPVYYATIQPFASFQVVSVNQDDFTEKMWDQTGRYTNVGLESVEGKTDSFKLGLGVRGSSQPIPLQWGQLAMTANMAWYHDFAGEQDRDFIAKFTNPGGSNFDSSLSDVTFRVYGNDPKQDWFNFGWGLQLDRNSTRFFLGANLYTNARQTLFTGNGGVVTSW